MIGGARASSTGLGQPRAVLPPLPGPWWHISADQHEALRSLPRRAVHGPPHPISVRSGRITPSATVAGLSERPRATDVVIRAARLEDVRPVLALWDQARSPAAVTPDDVRSVSRLIAHTEDALLVAEHDGQLVGALIAAWNGWRGNMYRLAVLPHLRRQGIRLTSGRGGARAPSRQGCDPGDRAGGPRRRRRCRPLGKSGLSAGRGDRSLRQESVNTKPAPARMAGF
jgi:hypothetical protein